MRSVRSGFTAVLGVGLILLTLSGSAPTAGLMEGAMKGAGTEGRRWVNGPEEPPGSMSAAKYEVLFTATVIPMRDGRMLDAYLYLPVR